MIEIHFLNVGHGDCSLIYHESKRITMIDINNGIEIDAESAKELNEYYPKGIVWPWMSGLSESRLLREKGYDIELTNPIAYLKEKYPNKEVFRYIQSHPDLDHMRGLVGLNKEAISITNFWDTEHDREPELVTQADEDEWKEYQSYRDGSKGITVLRCNRDSRGIFYSEDPAGTSPGDGWEILSPTEAIAEDAREAENWNNLSYVLRLTYKGIRTIFAGDAEKEVWDDLVAAYGKHLKCTVLKASHHGRDTGFHEEALKHMSPQYTIVSVGKKPDTDASNKYRKYSEYVWSTRWKGTIKITIDDAGKGNIESQYER